MQKLTKKNGLITWVKPEPKGFLQRENLSINYIEIVDENTVHIGFEDLGLFCFLVDDTELNGIIYNNSEEFINALNNQ